MLVIFFLKGASKKYLKMSFYVSKSFPAQVDRSELVTQLSFGEMVEFLQAAVFVLCKNSSAIS